MLFFAWPLTSMNFCVQLVHNNHFPETIVHIFVSGSSLVGCLLPGVFDCCVMASCGHFQLELYSFGLPLCLCSKVFDIIFPFVLIPMLLFFLSSSANLQYYYSHFLFTANDESSY